MALPSIQRTVLTTDATVTTLMTIPIPNNAIMGADGYVVARRTGGSAGAANDGAYYRLSVCIGNNAGTLSFIGNDLQSVGESQSSWDVTIALSGTNALVQVTGAANNNITWTGYVEMLWQT